ncbi:MAG: hypothetical protein ACYCZR_08045 [Burkholderiales bacterium]
MNNSTNGQDRAEKRRKMVGGSLIMALVLLGCVYFLPTHPIVVTAVILGFLLSVWWSEGVRHLASSLVPWILAAMSSVAPKILQCFRWPLRILGLPKNDD